MTKNRLFVFLAVVTPFFELFSTEILLVYNFNSRFHNIIAAGVIAEHPSVIKVSLTDDDLREKIEKPDVSAIIALGKYALKNCIDSKTKKPILFSLVNAPKYYEVNKLENVYGVSMDIPAKEFLNELKQIVPDAQSVATIYSSEVSKYQSYELDYFEKETGLRSFRTHIPTSQELYSQLEVFLDNTKPDIFYLLPDPLIDNETFEFISKVTYQRSIPLVTQFYPLVTKSTGIIAISPDYFAIGTQLGQMEKKLKTIKANEPKIEPPVATRVFLNLERAKSIGIQVPEFIRSAEALNKRFAKASNLYARAKYREAESEILKILKKKPDYQNAKALLRQIKLTKVRIDLKKFDEKKQAFAAIKVLRENRELSDFFDSELKKRISAVKKDLPYHISAGKNAFEKKKYNRCIYIMSNVLLIEKNNKTARLYMEKAKQRQKAINILKN